ncbi:hypothetical protein T265_03061 [Opisthorchis viverrini]|uniref:Ubiquitin-like domain-containing protein n=1 Tax=Opisthorchis viverrini TaxID=6198 RepID=A0A074ZXD7_OPIVI|nr:hypothetical protein T265_03061 [Opisthorchis viverrini]KER30587.1 hypothetical protein T265_03061 [Opisthorchis viverrini]
MLQVKDVYITDAGKTQELLKRFAVWSRENINVLENVLDGFPSSIDWDTLIDMFKDLDAPWTSEESYIILSQLDPNDNGVVSSSTFLHLTEQTGNTPTFSPLQSIHESTMLFTPDSESTVHVYLRPASSMAPGSLLNVELNVGSQTTIQQLSRTLLFLLDLPATELLIRESRYNGPQVDPNTKLEALNPEDSITLFYEYPVGYADCPLIRYDHYFKWRTVDRFLSE